MRIALLAVVVACGDGTSGTQDASTTDATIDAADTATYSAFSVIGGLDRIVIVKANATTCFGIVLRTPGNTGNGVTLPADWELESTFARQPAAACDPGFAGPVANMFDATSQSGSIAFQASQPTSITTLQVTLTFAGNPSWCPPSESLTATNLAVQ